MNRLLFILLILFEEEKRRKFDGERPLAVHSGSDESIMSRSWTWAERTCLLWETCRWKEDWPLLCAAGPTKNYAHRPPRTINGALMATDCPPANLGPSGSSTKSWPKSWKIFCSFTQWQAPKWKCFIFSSLFRATNPVTDALSVRPMSPQCQTRINGNADWIHPLPSSFQPPPFVPTDSIA